MKSPRNRYGWQKLSDVEVPIGILWTILLGFWLRRRGLNKAIEEFSEPANELAELLAERWQEGTQREEELIELQKSVERQTRWLVGLTIVVSVIGLVGAAGTIWAALQG